jgi:hypothetical protein
VNWTPVDVLASPTAPASWSLRSLPYTVGLMVIGLLGSAGVGAAAVLVTPDPDLDVAGSAMALASFGVITALTVVVPGAALVTLAIITRRRRSRAVYWWLVGVFATYILCGVGLMFGSSLLASSLASDASAEPTTGPPDPLWLGVVQHGVRRLRIARLPQHGRRPGPPGDPASAAMTVHGGHGR